MREYRRRILLVAVGLTPQVVTETVYALAVGEKPGWCPTEIRVVTTGEGRERVRLTLMEHGANWLGRLRKEYGLPAIRFGEEQIEVLKGKDGSPLWDLRSAEDSSASADGLMEAVRRATADDRASVHVSIAGGRKTMGFLLGSALSLYGREQDRLSHVLVDAWFESHPEFFYPSKEGRVIYSAPPGSRPLDTSKARVTLAEVPFVRLRGLLSEAALREGMRFEAAVQEAQAGLEASIEIRLKERTLRAGGTVVEMPPAELAFYAMLGRRVLEALGPVACPGEGPDLELGRQFLAEYAWIAGEGEAARTRQALRLGMDRSFFLQRRARVERALRAGLGARAGAYGVERRGERPNSLYGLKLRAECVRIIEGELEGVKR